MIRLAAASISDSVGSYCTDGRGSFVRVSELGGLCIWASSGSGASLEMDWASLVEALSSVWAITSEIYREWVFNQRTWVLTD
jgi:hypothetical protein